MKRRWYRAAVVGVLLFIACMTRLLCLPVSAEEYSDQREEPLYPYGDILDQLPDDAKKLIPPELSQSESSADILQAIDSNYLWKLCITVVKDGLAGALQLFATLLGLILICSVLTRISDLLFTDKSAYLEYAILLIAALQIYTSVYHLFDLTKTVVDQINQYMNALIVTLCGIFLMTGNSGVALMSSTWMGLLLTVAEKVCYTFFFPLMQISFGGTLVTSASPELNLRPILGFLRKICMTLLVIFMTVITLILSFQTSLAAAADSLSMRGIKFAASNLVPLIGGLFSDTLRTVSTSLSLVKKTVGTVGVLGLLAGLLTPLVSLFGAKYGLSLTATATELLDATPLKPILEEAERLISFLIAVLLMFGVFYLILLGVLMQTAGALG